MRAREIVSKNVEVKKGVTSAGGQSSGRKTLWSAGGDCKLCDIILQEGERNDCDLSFKVTTPGSRCEAAKLSHQVATTLMMNSIKALGTSKINIVSIPSTVLFFPPQGLLEAFYPFYNICRHLVILVCLFLFQFKIFLVHL